MPTLQDKNCSVTACIWGYRQELVGLILLIIATLITLMTWNGFGIAAMFLVGLALFAHGRLFCHCNKCHSDAHCGSSECGDMDHKDVKISRTKSKS